MHRLQQRLVITADGARLAAYVREPSHRAAATVVLAHGWTLDHRCWDPVIAGLPGTLRLVLWDQRGHGLSTLRDGRMTTHGESVRELGGDLATILDELVPADSPMVLCGHSMGAMTVMAYAGRRPDELRARVRGVVLASTACDDLHGLGIPGERLAMRVAKRVHVRPGRLVPRRTVRQVFGRHPHACDVAQTREQLGHTMLSTTATFYFALMAHDESASMPALDSVPTSVLVGTRDRLTPCSCARSLAHRLPHGSLTELPERGHMLPYEDADTVVAAIAAALRGHTLGETSDPELEQPFAPSL